MSGSWTGPRLVVAEGATPRDRGRSHGEQTADLIAEAIDAYSASFSYTHGLSWRAVTERAALWMPQISGLAPHLVEEMAGIADAAGVDVLDILALNARGEIVYDPTFTKMSADDAPEADGCSSFAITRAPDGHVYAGQNWDWRETAAPTVIALRIVQPGRPTVIMQAEAGQIGRQGANAAGIALNANGLGGRFGAAVGMPQAIIRRLILDSARFYDALRVPFALRQQIAANLLLTHRSGFAIDLETTPGRHRWGYPDEGLLVHANHYEYGVPEQLGDDYRPFAVDSLYRSPRLTELLRDGLRSGREVADTVERALSDHFGHPHGLCRHPDPEEAEPVRSMTIASSLVDLTTGRYRVAIGQPCAGRLDPLPWNLYDGSAESLAGAGIAAHEHDDGCLCGV
ncbi:C45 family peptidase [Agromyces silvae]|uniref:C45 family peptidase n=1 Tax=Agromyces silvae TaxID=3388266 RepID=UPI00280AAFC9|nr:C45 family peptidase [Agromyces protaetiae]